MLRAVFRPAASRAESNSSPDRPSGAESRARRIPRRERVERPPERRRADSVARTQGEGAAVSISGCAAGSGIVWLQLRQCPNIDACRNIVAIKAQSSKGGEEILGVGMGKFAGRELEVGGFRVRRDAALLLMIAVLSVMVLGACGAGGADEDGRVRVVATFSVIGEIVQRVGAEDVELRTLVGPNGDTHGFTPSPADQVAIARAELVFENGLGFEVWLDRLMGSSGSTAKRIVLSEGMEILGTNGNAPDPHVWLDARNMILMVDGVREALGEAAPGRAAEFDRRALVLISELEELDAWILAQIETIAPENGKMVNNHDSFGYFARRYGLEVVGMVIPSVTDDIVAPVAGEMAELVDLIREEGAPAVFAENVSSPRLAEQVAREAGVRLVEGLYTGALGPAGSEGETYDGMMRADVRLIVGALR